MSEKATTPAKKTELSARETEVLAAAWQCMESDPQIDMNKLAGLTGYTNPRSVSNMMSVIKKKLAALATQGNATTSATPTSGKGSKANKTTLAKKATTGAGSARKRKMADEEEDINASDEENSVDSPTPAKKARKPRIPKAKKSPEVVPHEQLANDAEEVEAEEHIADVAANVNEEPVVEPEGAEDTAVVMKEGEEVMEMAEA